MKSDQTIIRKNLMESLHFITNLLDIKDPNIKSVDIINMEPPQGNHWRNMIFKNRLRFLPLKRLACLLEFSLKTPFKVLSLLKNQLKKLLWPISLTSFPFQLQPSFGRSMTLVDFIRLCPETSTPLKWVLSVQGFKNQYYHCPWMQNTSDYSKSLSSLW